MSSNGDSGSLILLGWILYSINSVAEINENVRALFLSRPYLYTVVNLYIHIKGLQPVFVGGKKILLYKVKVHCNCTAVALQ